MCAKEYTQGKLNLAKLPSHSNLFQRWKGAINFYFFPTISQRHFQISSKAKSAEFGGKQHLSWWHFQLNYETPRISNQVWKPSLLAGVLWLLICNTKILTKFFHLWIEIWEKLKRLKMWLPQKNIKIKLQTFASCLGQAELQTPDDFWCHVHNFRSCVSKWMSCSAKVNSGISEEMKYLPAEERLRHPFYCLFRATYSCFHQAPCANSSEYTVICVCVYGRGNKCEKYKEQHLPNI